MKPDQRSSPFSGRPFSGRRCVVTGGAGFIGSNLTRALLDRGARVTVVDDFATGKRENLPEGVAELEVVEADLVGCAELPQLVSEADFVFHLAAQVGNLKSIEDPELDARTNVLGTVHLLRVCRDAGGEKAVEKIVYSSSSAGYGEAERIPIDENEPQDPESFYALSKLTAERYACLAAELWGLPVTSLRYFNVFGLPMEYNEYTGVISIFFRRLKAGEPLVIYGDGTQYRDFVYVQDVVQANLLAALRGRPGGVYNVGSGRRTTIQDLAETMVRLTGRESEIRHEAFRPGEVRESLADIGKAREELGYAPEYDLRQGLEKMWETLAESPSPPR